MNRSLHVLSLALALFLASLAPADEVRALWADSWIKGFLSPEQTDRLLEEAWSANYNAVLVEVRKTGDAYYKSTLEPRATNIVGDYDPLADLIAKARRPPAGKRPLEVHAWIVANRVWVGPKSPKKTDPPHLVEAHPDWLMKDADGRVQNDTDHHVFSDPAHPAVVEHMAAVVRELVGKYEIDGLHLDYIRYPGSEWGYSDEALRRFGAAEKPAPKDEKWRAWRRQQLDLLVRRISAEALAIRPNLCMSAATITWGGAGNGSFEATDTYLTTLQNWPVWTRMGWMDLIIPMNYKREGSEKHAKNYRDWIRLCLSVAGHGIVVSGQAAYLNTPEQSLAQMRVARELGAGVSTYSYGKLSSDDTPRKTVLRQFGEVFGPPTGMPDGPWSGKRRIVMGTVRDGEGRALDGARVSAAVGGQTRETIADGTGFYAFLDLDEARAELWSGAGAARTTVELLPGKAVRQDLVASTPRKP